MTGATHAAGSRAIAAAALVGHVDGRLALLEALATVQGRLSGAVDLALLFASYHYSGQYFELLAQARKALGARVLVGCSGQGVIGPAREVEGEPALALLAVSLPGAQLQGLHLSQPQLEAAAGPDGLRQLTGVAAGEARTWFLFVDPFTLDAEGLLAAFSAAYPGVPLVGGLASGDAAARRTHVFCNGEVFDHGAVALALGGPHAVCTVVSQGCAPIGQTWTITGAQGHVIESIGNRPALEVLRETLHALPPDLQQRARGNLLVGLAMDEYRTDFRRGDFLIRNLLQADRESGALVVGAMPRVGQTLQFQLRDPAAADEDLREMLGQARASLEGREPVAAFLFSCNGRGVGLFGTPDHDARVAAEALGTSLPLAGFFCNGEIGPVGPRNFLHGFTASLAILVPEDTPNPPAG